MTTKDEILNYLKTHRSATATELCAHLGISRQALNIHIKDLIGQSLIGKKGTTKSAIYEYGSGASKQRSKGLTYKKEYQLSGLEEDKVFHDLSLALPAMQKWSRRHPIFGSCIPDPICILTGLNAMCDLPFTKDPLRMQRACKRQGSAVRLSQNDLAALKRWPNQTIAGKNQPGLFISRFKTG